MTRPPHSAALLLAALSSLPVLPGLAGAESDERDEGGPPSAIGAETGEPDHQVDIDGGDDLFLFEELPVVVSASRQRTPQHLATTPVSVVTAEDLEHGIVTALPEAFAFVPGVDSLTLDRGSHAIGVRGLHDTFSDRTLTLIDGRPADNPIFGGATFTDYPLFVADIERIEVVRGPGGAVWGANAFTGVINIITKEPHATHGLSTQATASAFGDAYTHLRYGASTGAWDWRVGAGYDRVVSSQEALDDEDTSDEDWSRIWRAGVDATWHVGERDRFRFGFGLSDRDFGTVPAFSSTASGDSRRRAARGYARWEHDFEGPDRLEIEYALNAFDSEQPVLLAVEALEQDLSAKLLIHRFADHDLVVGANVRKSRIESVSDDREDFRFDEEAFREYWVGAYALDRWRFADRWLLEIQGRVDDYSQTGTDWSGRLAVLRELGPEKRHVVRAAAARAFRAPYAALRELRAERVFVTVPRAGEIPFVVIEPPAEELEHETTVAVEAGYNFRFRERWQLRLDAYYQDFDDLIGTVSRTEAGTGRVFTSTANIGGATSVGLETQLSWTGPRLSATAWHAFNSFEPDRDDQNFRAFEPAEHKVGTRLRWWFTPDLALSVDYQFVSETEAPESVISSGGADEYHRLDLQVGGAITDTRGSWHLGVHDLFDETAQTIGGGGNLGPHQTPGRTFLGRLSWEF